MTHSDIQSLLADILLSPCRLTPALIGPPGIGKTDLVHQTASTMETRTGHDHPVIEVLLSNADHTDLAGIPIPFKDEQGEAQTALTLSPILTAIRATGSDHGILFLDEYLQSTSLVQKVAANFKLTRKLGGHSLPDGWQIVTASNAQSDKSGVTRQMMHDLSRDYVIPVSFAINSWIGWASSAGIPGEWIGFAESHPGAIHVKETPATPTPFPTPRGFSEVCALLGSFSGAIPAYIWASVAGALGPATAGLMHTWDKGLSQLRPWAEFCADPQNTPIPEPHLHDQRAALAYRTANQVRTDTLDQACTLIYRLPLDLRRKFVRSVNARPGLAVRAALHPGFAQLRTEV